jgi:hypothetical protein
MHTNDASIHERFKPATSNSKPSSSSFGASMMNTRTFRLYGQSINYNANNQSNANPNSGTEGSLNTTSPNMMGSVKTNYSSVHNSSSINLDKQANLSGNTTVNPKANKNSTNKSINNIGTHRFKFVRCVANNQMGSNNSSKSYINGISGVSAEKTK